MRRAFTLIELLVVIAIIGVLSAVVLASLNTARAKGKDASVKSNMHTMATALTLYYDNNNSYGAVAAAPAAPYTDAAQLAYNSSSAFPFLSDKNTNDAVNAAFKASAGSYTIATGPGGSTYAVAFLLTAATGYWCIDSNGVSKLEATYPALGGGAAAAACP